MIHANQYRMNKQLLGVSVRKMGYYGALFKQRPPILTIPTGKYSKHHSVMKLGKDFIRTVRINMTIFWYYTFLQ